MLPEGSKIIKISAVSYIDKTGKKKNYSRKERKSAVRKINRYFEGRRKGRCSLEEGKLNA
jgi:hypothetical protein